MEVRSANPRFSSRRWETRSVCGWSPGCPGRPRLHYSAGPGLVNYTAGGYQALRVMEEAGLVRSSRRGRECVWKLQQRRLEEARRYLNQISTQWDEALGRL